MNFGGPEPVQCRSEVETLAEESGRVAGVEPRVVPQVTPAVNVSQARNNVASRHLAGGVVTSGAHVSGKQTLAFGLCLFVRVYKVNPPENT